MDQAETGFVRQKSDNRHGTGAPGVECLSNQELDNIKDTFEREYSFTVI